MSVYTCIIYVVLGLTIVLLMGCGVKGDPMPPEQPTELGRGRPTYKRAVEQIQLPNMPDYEDDESEHYYELDN